MKKLFLTLLCAALPLLGSAAPNQQTTWSVQHQPAAATAATISKAAVAATRHVATSLTVCISAVAAQPSIIFNLRDGATGAGTILWSARLSTGAGTSQCVTAPVFVQGSVNTAMTLESASAPAATNFATVSLVGYDSAYQ